MMRLLLLVLAMTSACGPRVETAAATLSVEYALIGQNPDSSHAVRCAPSKDYEFAAGCSAFTASTVGLQFPTAPIAWAKFEVTMTAHDARDAVRLRVYRWVQTDGVWATSDELFPENAPSLVESPRTVGFYLDPAWWQERPDGETHFVLEQRGSPTVYSAKLRVAYQFGGMQ